MHEPTDPHHVRHCRDCWDELARQEQATHATDLRYAVLFLASCLFVLTMSMGSELVPLGIVLVALATALLARTAQTVPSPSWDRRHHWTVVDDSRREH